MKMSKHKLSLVAAGVLAVCASNAVNAQTEEEVIELQPIVVEAANQSSVSHTQTDLGAYEINKMSISNIEDTTRYIPGVQVNDSGNRFGDNGFNIRGLEGDAVDVSVDGVSLGETLAPPNFSAYGMYDSNRGQVELEHVKSIRITKGPSSVINGRNALAGSVAYTTNSASDFLNDEGDDTEFRTRVGYDSRSSETMYSFTLANRSGNFETLLQYTKRDGNETEAHGDGLDIEGPNREQADPFSKEVDSILAKLAFNITDGQQIGLVYDQVDRVFDGTPLGRNSSEKYPTSYDNFVTDDENNKKRYGLFYTWNNADAGFFDSLSAKLDKQELFTSGITTFSFKSRRNPAAFLRREDRNTAQDSTSFNLDFTKVIEGNVKHDLVYGVRYETKDINNTRFDRRFNGLTDDSGFRKGYPILDPSWVPETKTKLFNLYVRDEMQLTDKFKFTAGLRYDNTKYTPTLNETFKDASGNSVGDAKFDALAGMLVAEYEFASGQSFLASYNQGYRAPSVQNLYLDTDGSQVIIDKKTDQAFIDLDTISNPDLEAEQASSFEIGYKLESNRANLTITAYKTKYDNMIRKVSLSSPYNPPLNDEKCRFDRATFSLVCVPAVVTVDDYKQPQNVGRVDVSGVEIDATYAWNNNLYSTFTYATNSGEYKDSQKFSHDTGNKLETASPDSATLGLGYQADGDRWGVNLLAVWFEAVEKTDDLSFTSLNNGNGPAYYPESYTVFDLLAYCNISDNLSLSAAAYNLTDKEYYRWEVVNSVRNGRGGFFGGVAEQGYKRYSEPGRSFSLQLTYTF